MATGAGGLSGALIRTLPALKVDVPLAFLITFLDSKMS
jgi:hypothetical protein